MTLDDCVALARRVGNEIWTRYRIPVFFYEAAATRPDRVNLENVRKGQFEGLRDELKKNHDRQPDVGEPKLHPTAGVTVVGRAQIPDRVQRQPEHRTWGLRTRLRRPSGFRRAGCDT